VPHCDRHVKVRTSISYAEVQFNITEQDLALWQKEQYGILTTKLYKQTLTVLVGKPEGMRADGRLRVSSSLIFGSSKNEVRVDWIILPQDPDQWEAPVSTVMSLRVYKQWEIS
jgi:hypothetical protein